MGYTAFGETYAPNTTTTVDQRYTYTGRESSSVGAPMYYRYRMYDAAVGRFGGRDPAESPEWNLYGYVGNRPYRFIDPFGMAWWNPLTWFSGDDSEAGEEKPCCDGTEYDPDEKCCWKNSSGKEVLIDHVPAPTGFVAAGQVVRAVGNPGETKSQGVQRKIGNKSEIHHYDIYYDDTQIYVGFGGAVNTTAKSDISNNKQYALTRSDNGQLRWGEFAGLSCKCASAEKIVDCIKSHSKPTTEYSAFGGNNCQTDVEHALKGCCLTGFTALGVPPSERNYLKTEEERKAFDEQQAELNAAAMMSHMITPYGGF